MNSDIEVLNVPTAVTEAVPQLSDQQQIGGDSEESEDQGSGLQEHVERLQAVKRNLMTAKDVAVLTKYLQGEGTVERSALHCDSCSRSCFGCIKKSRWSAQDEITLKQMEDNLQQEQLIDKSFCFRMKYLFLSDPKDIFTVKNSNYQTALDQSRRN